MSNKEFDPIMRMKVPKNLSVADIDQWVKYIDHLTFDCERAHGAEDDLHRRVLKMIADGTCENPKVCAREALRTLDIDFSRWYA